MNRHEADAGDGARGDTVAWIDDQRLEIGGVRFIASAATADDDEQFVIVKPPSLVRRYLDLLDAEQPRRLVELGIKAGGSTALLWLACKPDLMLAVDLESEIPALLERLDAPGLVTAFGLDQGDRAALTRFVDAHIPGGDIDVVIDDASHILGPTRVSFEVLFPRMRAGGLYVIEDWTAECVIADVLGRSGPVDRDRVAQVGLLLQILNDPDREPPPEVVASMTEVAAAEEVVDGSVFERLIRVAGRSDLSALAEVPSRPMSDLAVELVMISAVRPDIVAEVRTDAEWITVRRGPAELDRDGFRLADCGTDLGYLSGA